MLKLNFSEQTSEGWQIRSSFCLELPFYLLTHTKFLLSRFYSEVAPIALVQVYRWGRWGYVPRLWEELPCAFDHACALPLGHALCPYKGHGIYQAILDKVGKLFFIVWALLLAFNVGIKGEFCYIDWRWACRLLCLLRCGVAVV